VGEANDQLVHYLALPDGARHSLYLNVIGPVTDKMFAIKSLNLRAANTPPSASEHESSEVQVSS
jgi:hypothetical protein